METLAKTAMINKQFKTLRQSLSLTCREVAERLNVSLSLVKSWEAGRRSISPVHAKLICNEFNVNESWLTSGKGSMNTGVCLQDVIMSYNVAVFGSLPAKKREATLRFLARYILDHGEGVRDNVSDEVLNLCRSYLQIHNRQVGENFNSQDI